MNHRRLVQQRLDKIQNEIDHNNALIQMYRDILYLKNPKNKNNSKGQKIYQSEIVNNGETKVNESDQNIVNNVNPSRIKPSIEPGK